MPNAPRNHRPSGLHAAAAHRLVDKFRPNANRRGYTYSWSRDSKAFLDEFPLCRLCFGYGRVEAATVVDHIVPHRGDKKLFWRRDNWQPLCKHCHDSKTGSGH